MIKFELLGECCEDCPNFDVKQDTLRFIGTSGTEESIHYVRCKNEEICKNIKEHLQGVIQK